MRVLLTGWAGFLHGEATAGDVLSLDAAAAALAEAGTTTTSRGAPVAVPATPVLGVVLAPHQPEYGGALVDELVGTR
ncbi:hypothetical protein [Amycolatopsis sp. NPDC004625]|uniref:hypothetical protein n=1 Tax=Amycolatopsis sp. NPDC004625 TaxID=3154670 RepID=UPI0033BAA32F